MQLNVITDSDRTGIGRIDARVGMELANGYTISKVNEKTVVAECKGHKDRFDPLTSIFYSEAVCWGFSHSEIDKQVENLAAITRKFRQGESVYQQYLDYNYAPALSDRIEEAGFASAKQVEAHRQRAIAQLEKAGVAIDAKVLFEKVEVIDSAKLSLGEKHEIVNQ